MKNKLLTLCLIYVFLNQGVSQNLYFTNWHTLPQANSHNASIVPLADYTISLPIISNIGSELQNNAVGLNLPMVNDLRGIDDAKLEEDIKETTFNFSDKNYFHSTLKTQLLGLGMLSNETTYFSINVYNVLETNIQYPKDFGQWAKELADGSTLQENYNWTDFDINNNWYTSIEFGFAYMSDNGFAIGLRPKVYLGHQNLYTRNSDYQLNINGNETTSTGQLNILSSNHNMFSDTTSIVSSLTNNLGFGVDFGVNLWFNDYVQIGLGVNNIGFIKWKKNLSNIEINTTNSSSDLTSFFGEIKEDLDESVPTFSSYTAAMNPDGHIFLGFYPAGSHSINFTVGGKILPNKKLVKMASVSYNYRLLKLLSIIVDGNLFEDNLTVGSGVAVNLGPIQLYSHVNGLNTLFLGKDKTKALGVMAGLNIVFGKHAYE